MSESKKSKKSKESSFFDKLHSAVLRELGEDWRGRGDFRVDDDGISLTLESTTAPGGGPEGSGRS
jgi:hypothetical protein